MRELDVKVIEEAVYRLALKAGRNLTPSCKAALKAAEENEAGLPKYAFSVINKNADLAKKENYPVCQDTGLSVVVLEIGQEVLLTGAYLGDAVNNAVKRAYNDGYFRKSSCDPLTRVNTGDNTPAVLYTEIVKGDKVTVHFLPKGFGSENMSRIYMLNPSEGTEGIINAVVETVKIAGSRPCPPVYVGVGIGGTFDKCAFTAKKALMRPVGEFNKREDVMAIEKEALKRINELKIGAQGFGGKTTALHVAAEVIPTHIAGLPVAINIQCHCVRYESEVI